MEHGTVGAVLCSERQSGTQDDSEINSAELTCVMSHISAYLLMSNASLEGVSQTQ